MTIDSFVILDSWLVIDLAASRRIHNPMITNHKPFKNQQPSINNVPTRDREDR